MMQKAARILLDLAAFLLCQQLLTTLLFQPSHNPSQTLSFIFLTFKIWHDKLCFALGAWCSGRTCGPVKAETAGSNPVAPARKRNCLYGSFFLFTQ